MRRIKSADPATFYRLNWLSGQDGKLAIDRVSGAILEANPAAEAISGYSRGELIGKRLPVLAPPDERERVLRELRETADVPRRYVGFHAQRKDGRLVPVTISTSGSVRLADRMVFIAAFRDVTEQERDQQRLFAQNWALGAFSRAALALTEARCESTLLQSMCEAVTQESAYVLCFLSVAGQGPGSPIRFSAASASSIGYLENLHFAWAESEREDGGPAGACIRTGQVQIANDLASNCAEQEGTGRFGVRSAAAIPLWFRSGERGALVVFCAEPYAFGPEPVQVFQRLGEMAVHGVEALRREELLAEEGRRLKEAQDNLSHVLTATVAALVTATEMRDPYTAGHETRVAEIAQAIGREVGWDEGRLMGMRLGALVHDVGKIAIPAEILTKPGRLTAAEFEVVKAHSESGFDILKDIPFPWPVAEMVRQHHERLDGSGYPLGISGDAILPESRVLAVADVVEAMITDRPYRRAHALESALAEIGRMAGTMLDSEVVRVCVRLFREGRLVARRTG